ncbi:NAD(P)-binding protein [Ganoderma leucocontextum]|nr:NAD(P)-binding protein [Ganoderma leucocontextum]
MSLPTVTIIGGTGVLGQNISNAFVTDFRPSFSRVRILTRDPASTKSQQLASKGAELVKVSEGADAHKLLDEAFADTDVIVNALPGSAPEDTQRAILQAAARSSAKVYFLDEFGCDHRINDFPGYESPEFLVKQKLAKEARSSFKGKVIALYTALFFEVGFAHPIVGIDVKNNAFTAYGSPAQRVSWTSLGDIGRAVARLAILATNPATAASIPDDVRIAGSTATFEDVRDTVARVKGIAPAQIKTEDLAAKKAALKAPDASFLEYLRLIMGFRVVMGEGKADFGENNNNELVNPGGKFWKWKSVEDFVRGL